MSPVACPNCGKQTASTKVLPKYHYRESGLDTVWLTGGVTETRCRSCSKTFIRVWKEAQLLQVIALGLLTVPKSLAGPEWRFLRRACGLTQAQLASLLKYPRRETVAEREAKPNPRLSFPEEVGSRWVLVSSFQRHLAKPGNSSLEASQLEKLWSFAAFFRDFSDTVQSAHERHRITAVAHGELWTLSENKPAA
jgi:hypothetical protein